MWQGSGRNTQGGRAEVGTQEVWQGRGRDTRSVAGHSEGRGRNNSFKFKIANPTYLAHSTTFTICTYMYFP